ncbi:MAG: hypothetical protein ACE5KT_11515 [Methanosarcinales archaeon]
MYELSEIEIAVLMNICLKTNISKSAHIPEQYFMKKFHGNERKFAKKALSNLIRKGYVQKHPTRGEMTYKLTKKGMTTCMKIINREI